MTPENIANAFNIIDRRFIEIERRLDEMPEKIMDKMKIWILGSLLVTLVTGIIIPLLFLLIKHNL